MRPLQRVTAFILSASAVLCLSAAAWAQRRAAPAPKRAADASRHSNEAAEVLRRIMSVPEKEIPRDLLESAEAVAVCPGVLKAAFVIGGRTMKRQWGAPAFYNLAGGSVGAQIGGTKTDYVLLFMNAEALKGL